MLRIVFFGTPKFASTILEALITDGNYDIVGVVTQPDKEVGRKKEIKYSPVKELAIKHNIKVLQPRRIKKEFKEILDLKPDMIVTAAYGQIIGEEILNYPKYKCVNVHASLLPKYRGGAPIQRAIMNGDSSTGITIMYMAKGMDDGDMLLQEEVEIEDTDTSTILFDKLSVAGSKLLLKAIPLIINGVLHPIKQDESKVTFAYNIKPEEERLDYNLDSYTLYNKIRALLDEPIAYFYFKGFEDDANRIKVIDATPYDVEECFENGDIINITKKSFSIACGNHTALKINKLKPNGKTIMDASAFVNGGLKKYIK